MWRAAAGGAVMLVLCAAVYLSLRSTDPSGSADATAASTTNSMAVAREAVDPGARGTANGTSEPLYGAATAPDVSNSSNETPLAPTLNATTPACQREDGWGGHEDPAGPLAPVYAVPHDPSAPSRGAATAPVVIEHFCDYRCPYCSRVDPTLAQVVERYGDRVRVVFRDHPMPWHDGAALAAEAALAAASQGKFREFRAMLLSHQTALDRASLERYARDLGLDVARFRRSLDRHEFQAEVEQDSAAADALGVPGGIGVPATFVNGRLIAGAVPFDQFVRVIDAALADARIGALSGAGTAR